MEHQPHRLNGYQRVAAWGLALIERCLIPLAPRGSLRQRLRAWVDSAQARLHERIEEREK
jgi:hypothetical protein